MKPKLLIMMRFQYVMPIGMSKSWEYERICHYVYQEDRLKQRFWIFENICLPSLRAQKDQGFRLVMLSSPEMPDWAKERLFALLEPFEADVIWDRGRNWKKAFQNYIDVNFAGNEEPILTMRLDDDDAISVDMVETLHKIAVDFRDIVERRNSMTIYASHGVVLDANHEAEPFRAIWTRTPNVGLSRLVKAGVRGHAYSFGHIRATKSDYTFSVPTPFLFMRVLHQSNISHMNRSHHLAAFKTLEVKPEILMQKIEEKFAFDVACLKDWPKYQDSLIKLKGQSKGGR